LYGGTQGSKLNFATAVNKYDIGLSITNPPRDYGSDELWDVATDLAYQMHASDLRKSPMSWEEAVETIVPNTSPGFPYTYMGYKKKGMVLARPEFRAHAEAMPPCYFKVAWKHEWKEITDIAAGKVRTFATGPLHLQVLQTMMFGNQNAALKRSHWIYHGFSPFSGGFNGLAKKLLSNEYRAMRDWSGFDRLVWLMKRVYTIRLRGLREHGPLTEQQQAWADHVAAALANPQYILDDGSVWSWPWSNPSGQGATTEDNCLAHLIIEIRMLLEIDPGLQIEALMEIMNALYGDDHVGSYPEKFKQMADRSWFTPKVAAIVGMPLKRFEGGYLYPLENLTFLGAAFKFIPALKVWVPCWSRQRIRDAFMHGIKRVDTDTEIQKCYSLVLMSWPDRELFYILSRVYTSLLGSAPRTPLVDALRMLGVPTLAELIVFYTGLEASYAGQEYVKRAEVMFFLSEVGGHKKFYMNDRSSQAKRVKSQATALRAALLQTELERPKHGGHRGASLAPSSGSGARGGGAGKTPGGRVEVLRVHPGLGDKSRQGHGSTTAKNGARVAGAAVGGLNSLPRRMGPSTLRSAGRVSVAKEESGAPVAIGSPLKVQMQTEEYTRNTGKNGNVIVSGSEYFCAIGLLGAGSVNTNAGAMLAQFPLHPAAFGGTRLSQEAQQYDLFKWRRLVVEYVPACATTTGGNLVGAASLDMSENLSLPGTEGTLRAMFARSGCCSAPVWSGFSFELNQTQLEWYSVLIDNSDPSTTFPGMFNLAAGTDLGTATTQLGIIWIHYEIEFVAPATEEGTDPVVTASQAVVAPDTAAANGALVSWASPGLAAGAALAAGFQDANFVFCGTILAAGTVTPSWNNLVDPAQGVNHVFGPGKVIWFRWNPDTSKYYAYPNMAGVLQDANANLCLGSTVAITASAGNSLTLINVRGFRLSSA